MSELTMAACCGWWQKVLYLAEGSAAAQDSGGVVPSCSEVGLMAPAVTRHARATRAGEPYQTRQGVVPDVFGKGTCSVPMHQAAFAGIPRVRTLLQSWLVIEARAASEEVGHGRKRLQAFEILRPELGG
jgi:hypothetical protein